MTEQTQPSPEQVKLTQLEATDIQAPERDDGNQKFVDKVHGYVPKSGWRKRIATGVTIGAIVFMGLKSCGLNPQTPPERIVPPTPIVEQITDSQLGRPVIETPTPDKEEDPIVIEKPTDPEPTDPEPTDPEPTDPEPTDPEPTEPEPNPEPTPPKQGGGKP